MTYFSALEINYWQALQPDKSTQTQYRHNRTWDKGWIWHCQAIFPNCMVWLGHMILSLAFLCMFVYVCVCLCMFLHRCVYLCMFVNVCECLFNFVHNFYFCLCSSMCVYDYVCLYVCVCFYIVSVFLSLFIYVCVCLFMLLYVCVYHFKKPCSGHGSSAIWVFCKATFVPNSLKVGQHLSG